MGRHFDEAPGLCEQPDEQTRQYLFNHTMLRVKDPVRSLDFYTRVLGMRLLNRLDFEGANFTLYFLGYVDDAEAAQWPAERGARQTRVFNRPAVLELTHNWGTEDDPEFEYHDGNEEPKGFGHIAITVPDVYEACERFEQLGVDFVKRPDEGGMKGLAFIRDPDGYWIEILRSAMME